MKSLIYFTLMALAFASCQKSEIYSTKEMKEAIAEMNPEKAASLFNVSKIHFFTNGELATDFEMRPGKQEKVNFHLLNTSTAWASGIWDYSSIQPNYGYWYQYSETSGLYDSTLIYLQHVIPHPQVVGATMEDGQMAVRLSKQTESIVINQNGVVVTTQSGTWALAGVYGIFAKYSRGSGKYTYTYSPKQPTGWYADGTGIDLIRREINLTGKLR